MKENSLSVIIPVYNAENTISGMLDSILSQSVEKIEIICVDDGSTDASPAILEEYRQAHGEVRIVSIPNSGPGTARNEGIRMAEGEYLTFCDADDLLPEGALKTLLKLAEDGVPDVVSGKYTRVDRNRKVNALKTSIEKTAGEAYRFLKQGGCYARLYRTAFLRDHEICFPPSRQAEDRLFAARVFAAHPVLRFTDRTVYYYNNITRQTGDNRALTADGSAAAFQERLENWKEYWKICESEIPKEELPFVPAAMILGDFWKRLKDVDTRERNFSALRCFLEDRPQDTELFLKGFGIPREAFLSCSCYEDYVRKLAAAAIEADTMLGLKGLQFAGERPEEPAVSVIVPVYNAENYLLYCLLSICAQRFRDFEVLLIDDGCTDTSPFIMDMICGLDRRFRVIRGNGKGAGAARNIGLDQAAGRYMMFLDADDFFGRDMLWDAWSLMEQRQLDLCIWNGEKFDDQTGKAKKTNSFLVQELLPEEEVFAAADTRYILNFTSAAPWNKMFRADYVRAQQVRFMELHRFNDIYAIRALLVNAKRISVIRKEEMYYRDNNHASLQGSREQNISEMFPAVEALHERIVKDGLWECENIRISFLNYLLNLTVSALRTCSQFEAFEQLFGYIQDSSLLKLLQKDSVHSVYLMQYLEYQRAVQQGMAEYLFNKYRAKTSNRVPEQQVDELPLGTLLKQRLKMKSRRVLRRHLSDSQYRELKKLWRRITDTKGRG